MEESPNEPRRLTRRRFLRRLGVYFSAGLTGMGLSRLLGLSPHPTAEGSQTLAGTPETETGETLTSLANLYLESARRNIKTTSSGQKVIVPSQMYGEVYLRDTFFALVGLEDPQLNQDSFRLFSSRQQGNGQMPTAISLDQKAENIKPQDDESTLLFLIWAGLRTRAGEKVDPEKIKQAYSFVSAHVQEGWYFSSAGDFRYWADTYINRQRTVISYKQGLFALAVKMLKEYQPDLVSDQLMHQAQENYRNLFRRNFGFIPLSNQTNYQDASVLLPELLSRLYLGQGMLEEDKIITAVDHLISTATVRDDKRQIRGIKAISQPDGSFLPLELFTPHLRGKGEYQNGAYWPMFILSSLCLAYSINRDPKYQTLAEELIKKELGGDGKSKEFISLSPENPGIFDPLRSDYSWNALIYTALRFAKMI